MENIIRTINENVWGVPMLTLLLGTGIYLTVGLRFLSVMKLPLRSGSSSRPRTRQAKGTSRLSAR